MARVLMDHALADGRRMVVQCSGVRGETADGKPTLKRNAFTLTESIIGPRGGAIVQHRGTAKELRDEARQLMYLADLCDRDYEVARIEHGLAEG